MAAVQARRGDRGEAISLYEASLKISPDSASLHNDLGGLLFLEGHRDDAVAHYRQSIALDAVYLPPKINLASALFEAGQYDDCAKELDALLDPKGKRPLTQANVKETARIYHSACLIGSGQFERADQPLRDAIRDNLQMKPPDSLVFPRAVVERFLRVQQSMNEEIRAAEAKRLERAKELAARKQEQERLQAREPLHRVVGADPGHDRVVALEVRPLGRGRIDALDRHAEPLQRARHVVPRALDPAHEPRAHLDLERHERDLGRRVPGARLDVGVGDHVARALAAPARPDEGEPQRPGGRCGR